MTRRYSTRARWLASVLAACLLTAGACGGTAPVGVGEAPGFSQEGLERLSATMQQAVDDGEVAGIVTLVLRGGEVAHHAAFGHLDREAGVPMPPDAIFRIASMSKAVTSVAAMMLAEEGRLSLDDPVSRFLPAYARTTVMGETAEAPVPAAREIVIRDLLTHTAGISYGTGPLEATYKAHDLYFWYFADKDEPIQASMTRLASLPFSSQPGEAWVYGYGTDLLGAVVEVASEQTLDAFFRTRIFEPLGMTDTSFYLPVEKRGRLAVVYSAGDGGLRRAPEGWIGQGDYVEGPRVSFSGGAGLLSTATDYARFLQMLLNGGELEGVRLLSPASVDEMTTNQVGDLSREGRFGFGLGFEIVEDVALAERPASTGEFSWGGAYFTRYFVAPAYDVVAVFLSQLLPSGRTPVQDRFRRLVYEAIE
jgi:CubicO group peptidase (beta-lactamase class C family)